MSPLVRRICYVASYEIFAIALTTLGLLLLGFGGGHSTVVAVAASTVAVVWNFIWTTMFEAWERRQDSRVRTLPRRIAHAVGFEGGLVVLLLPIVAWILQVSLLQALSLEAGLLVFFLVYTFVFAWLFDMVWPPEKGRRPRGSQQTSSVRQGARPSSRHRPVETSPPHRGDQPVGPR